MLVVVVVAMVGIVVELATSRHWHGASSSSLWFAAGLLLVALRWIGRGAPAVCAPGAPWLRLSRWPACSAWEHVEGNYDSGPLDFRYATSWASMSEATRWWKAVSGGVGAAPPIVPGALALVAGLLVVATFGPGGRSGDRTG